MDSNSNWLSRAHDLAELEQAARSGALDKVRSLWAVIKAEEDDVELAASEVICSVAVEHCQKEVLKFLLSHGIRPTAGAIATAARDQCTDCLEMLLDHGWDINSKLGGRYPPVLRYDEDLHKGHANAKLRIAKFLTTKSLSGSYWNEVQIQVLTATSMTPRCLERYLRRHSSSRAATGDQAEHEERASDALCSITSTSRYGPDQASSCCRSASRRKIVR